MQFKNYFNYLITCVKIQFIKTFILPYFDYCSTLCIYYSIDIIQKLANTYNNCLFKLINTKQICNLSIQTSSDFNKWNNLLSIYNLNSFQHRILFRLHFDYYIPSIGVFNEIGSKQFIYFFSKFINEIMTRDDIELNLEFYKARVKKKINLLFIDFISIFTNFDLKFKTFYDIKLKRN